MDDDFASVKRLLKVSHLTTVSLNNRHISYQSISNSLIRVSILVQLKLQQFLNTSILGKIHQSLNISILPKILGKTRYKSIQVMNRFPQKNPIIWIWIFHLFPLINSTSFCFKCFKAMSLGAKKIQGHSIFWLIVLILYETPLCFT